MGLPREKRPLYRYRCDDIWKREAGIESPLTFARAVGGSQALIERFKLYRRLEGHDGCVNTVSFTPGGELLLSGSDDRNIVLWDWDSGAKKLTYFSGHENNVFQARAMPFTNNQVVVSCAADGQVRLGRIPEGAKDVGTKGLARHRGRAHKLAIEPGSPNCFFSCGEDGLIRHFDLRDTKAQSKLFTVRAGEKRPRKIVSLNAIVINPRQPLQFCVGGSDVFARVYDLRRTPLSNHERSACVDSFAPLHLLKSEAHITCVAYSEQEELLVSYNDELIYNFERDQGLGPDYAYKDSDDSDETAEEVASSDSGEGSAGNPKQATNKPRVYQGHRNAKTVKGVNFFGMNSEYVVSGSDCGNIFLWKKTTQELVAMFPGDSSVVNCLEPHPHATILATSGIESDVKIWTPTGSRNMGLPDNAEKVMKTNTLRRRRDDSRRRTTHHTLDPELLLHLVALQREHTELLLPDPQRAAYDGVEEDDDDDETLDESEDSSDEEGEGEEGGGGGRRSGRSRRPPECRVA